MALSGVARPQVRQTAAVFYPFGHPTPYAYKSHGGKFGWWRKVKDKAMKKRKKMESSAEAENPLSILRLTQVQKRAFGKRPTE
jgi:hypothetical protein